MPVSTFLMNSEDAKLYSMTDGVKLPSRTAELQTVIDWAEYDPFWAARGKAIQEYAHLESSLCHLLSALSDMPWESAVLVFYKITNTRARNDILEKLLHKKCDTKFNPFWNPYVREVSGADRRRNEIVHWLAAANVLINSENQVLAGVSLIPPASATSGTPVPDYITTKDLIAFANKCNDLARLAIGLAAEIKPPDGHVPSPDIFQQPLIYPLPEPHRYRALPQVREIHPRSLPESLQFLRLGPDGLLQRWDP